MANELKLYASPGFTGATVFCRLFDEDSLTQVGADITCTEIVAGEGIYAGDAPGGLAAGEYIMRFYIATNLIGQAPITWDGTEIIEVEDTVEDIKNKVVRPDVRS